MRLDRVFRPTQYLALRGSTEAEQQAVPDNTKHRRRLLHSVSLLWLNLAFFLVSSAMFILSLKPSQPLYRDQMPEQERNHYLKHVSMPSWASLYDTRPVALTRDQVISIGKDPAEAVRIPPYWGRGNDSYFGRIDVFHQMHCLDGLRREVHFGHYYSAKYPGGFNTTTEMHQLHLSHCVWMLAQNIVCSASTDVYTHMWTDALEFPFLDFKIWYQCKNYDAVMAWQKRNALDEDAFVALRRPEGYPYRVMTHKFKDIHAWFSDHEDGDFEPSEIA
ncbi:hypothetical protein OIDMADRAFT_37083 [Oidiodendron maius Zn]|uniref:Tat pathway signal sequence n=1 Tax=Oidiodendron maius (strain Zn) TaxID=913774 RepID=A0A0C3HXS4_OIDMZ|nr:hypothetical protein OIDMADRAFT_37083 [Oidiodendron maius Zn]